MEGFKETGTRQPEIGLVDGGVRLTVRKRNVGSYVGSLLLVQLTERQKEIVRLIQKNDRISAADMSVVKRTIERELAKMQEMDIRSRESNTSAGRWMITELSIGVSEELLRDN